MISDCLNKQQMMKKKKQQLKARIIKEIIKNQPIQKTYSRSPKWGTRHQTQKSQLL